MFYWNLKNHDREVNPRKRREKGGKRIYKERIVKNHQLNPAWKTITVYVVISCKGCKFGGREAWLGLLLESRANPERVGRNVCVPNKLRQPCKRWRFSGVLHCPETDIKMTRHDNGFVKERAELFSLLHRLRVPFLALFFLFLTARPIGVQPPPQLLHFRYPNHQRQIDTGVCVWHRYGQLVSTADCYYYLCIPLNVTKGEE